MPRAWADPKKTSVAGRTARARRKPRWGRAGLAGVLACAAILGTFVLVGRTGGNAEQSRRIDRQVSKLLAGIPQQGDTLGQPTAPVTLQFFGDLECLTTKIWVMSRLPAIVDDFVRRGIVKIEYRSFKTDTIDPRVFVKQQTAALAAGVQSRLWSFVETFYQEQGREYTPYVTESYLDGIAQQIPGLSLTLWHRDRLTGRRTEQVVADDRLARAVGFHDTPAFRIGLSGKPLRTLEEGETVFFHGQRYPVTLIDAENVENAVKKLL
ncbi:MAG: DsbA family protein [Solirubrobacteraceae bacterium]